MQSPPRCRKSSKAIDPGKSEVRDWQSLVGDGSVRRLIFSVSDVNKSFRKIRQCRCRSHPEEGDPDDTFIDLYVADVAVPTIGRSLLGDDGYDRLAGRLKPGQQALIVAGSGRYRFKGAAYVRGGIFDRIELIQDTKTSVSATAITPGWATFRPRVRLIFPKLPCSRYRLSSRSIRPSHGCCSCWCSG